MSELVRLAAAPRPLLLVFDDVHDAQESSLWLLTHLVPMLRSSPALVLVQSHVQHPLGDAWPVDAGLVVDMTPNLPPDGFIAVSDHGVVDCSRLVATAVSPVESAAR